MKSSIYYIILLVFLPLTSVWAQETYGNEWIVNGQSYFKVKVFQEGIYRLSYEELRNAGVPDGIDPRRFQLFRRGVEQAIFVKGPSGSPIGTPLGNGDFIEFFGQPNDGKSDTDLYLEPSFQAHTYYNIFSDTAAYFLTWNLTSTSNKRMTFFNEVNTNNIPTEPFHREILRIVSTDAYRGGISYENEARDTYLSAYDYGEGWSGARIANNQSRDYTFTNLTKTVSSGNQPQLVWQIGGISNVTHQYTVSVGRDAANLRTIFSGSLSAYEFHSQTFPLEWSDLGSNLLVRISCTGGNVALRYAELSFGQNFDYAGEGAKDYYLVPNPTDKAFVRLSNAGSGLSVYDVSDVNQVRRIGFSVSGSAIDFTVNQNTFGRRIWVKGSTSLIPLIEKVNFRAIAGAPNYLIVSHPALTRPASGSANPVRDYAAYRASASGGGFDTLIMMVPDLYNQFNYGDASPIAIRRFARYMLGQGTSQGYLFLMGKAISPYTPTVEGGNVLYRKAPQNFSVGNWVPSFGYPGGDILFSSDAMEGLEIFPRLYTGRLSARSPQEVKNYLDKIRAMESLPYDELWRKRNVLLSGGLSFIEVNNFRRYIGEFKSVLDGPYLGGETQLIFKESNQTVQLINISEEVNQGTNLISFFGHSGSVLTDIDIGLASQSLNGYQNQGKYPFMVINGCIAGTVDINNPVTLGEDWLITAEKGAIGFLAHTNQGLPRELKLFTDLLLQYAYSDTTTMHWPIGQIHKKVMEEYAAQRISSGVLRKLTQTQIQQFLLQCDPAYTLFGARKPDYSTRAEEVSIRAIGTEPITALSDSFTIQIVAKNFGRTSDKPFQIAIDRTLPNGTLIKGDTVSYDPVYFQDTLAYTFRYADPSAFGINRFQIYLDPLDSIAEINEGNNTVQFEYFFSLGGTVNLLPYNYAIQSNTSVTLKAQSADIFSSPRGFDFEIDTLASFTSPWKKSTTVNARVLAEWPVTLLSKDSTVYYWRSRYSEPTANESDAWKQSSFTFINADSRGFMQKSSTQLGENQLNGLNISTTGTWDFQSGAVQVRILTVGSNASGDETAVEVQIDGRNLVYPLRYCNPNSVNAIAFDRASGEPYRIVFTPGQFDILDPLTCGARPQVINHFPNTFIENVSNTKIQEYFDGLPEGDFVVLFSIKSAAWETFVSRYRNELLAVGATASVIDNLQDGEPFILIGKKGYTPGQAAQLKGALADTITLAETLETQFTTGLLQSAQVGPALNWQQMKWDIQSEAASSDSYSYDVVGLDVNGNETLLFANIQEEELDISSINSTQYPYVKVRLRVSDAVDLSPPQVKKWSVSYQPVAEGILMAENETLRNQETAPEGKALQRQYAFQNISEYAFTDSVAVRYRVFNQNQRKNVTSSFKIAPLAAGQDSAFTLPIATQGMVGLNDFFVQANTAFLPEQVYTNNVAYVPAAFQVERDERNPLLEVTFDGQRIINGDIVAPRPLVRMVMKDDNPYLRKSDTTGIRVRVRALCEECTYQTIPFSGEELRFVPASAEEEFTMEYQPTAPFADGVYELEVQVADASGNLAGAKPYTISFEVINASSITHFYPYPNPFSTKMWFVFTLTGSQIPDQIKVQIMTVTGRVVREITQEELGPIHIGNNRSAYAWDGRDEFGDLLANGVYLYRVIVKSNGSTVDHRGTQADKAFEKGFGKIYILR
ncbi:C25 family cysteine peptidase [Cytophagales bacterium LB-30]|uniref:C25 family cysteine peptidase n=1 Tax=Shiella aurantiaca TaxID=3058365 RepID=A0ABT8F7W3_9BACT|nr:C25 family cysteine peptidase [Shiella aurantiaca]MDN4166475.1 C25 family cysteine peptidase [Shiella aurantiaca]